MFVEVIIMTMLWITLLCVLKLGLVFSFLTIQQQNFVYRECGKRILNHNISGNHINVKSKTDCAAHCLTTPQCKTILFDIKLERGEESTCSLIAASSEENPYVMVDDPPMCFMVTDGTSVVTSSSETMNSTITTQVTTSTTISTTTTTTSPSPLLSSTTAAASTTKPKSSFAGTIIDMINNVNNLCSTNSQHDIAIVTTNGVHLYDNADSLTTGACKNMTISALFQGFAALPDENTWSALLTYNNVNLDLFTNADDLVYRWQKDSGKIVPVGGYPKSKQDYLQNNLYITPTPTNPFVNLQWAVYRSQGAMAMFFKDSSMIQYYRNQSPKEGVVFINDTSNMDSNSRPINPWYNLPEGVVAITGLENVDRFMVIDENLDVYSYELTNSDDFNTVPPSCTLIGKLRL